MDVIYSNRKAAVGEIWFFARSCVKCLQYFITGTLPPWIQKGDCFFFFVRINHVKKREGLCDNMNYAGSE